MFQPNLFYWTAYLTLPYLNYYSENSNIVILVSTEKLILINYWSILIGNYDCIIDRVLINFLEEPISFIFRIRWNFSSLPLLMFINLILLFFQWLWNVNLVLRGNFTNKMLKILNFSSRLTFIINTWDPTIRAYCSVLFITFQL